MYDSIQYTYYIYTCLFCRKINLTKGFTQINITDKSVHIYTLNSIGTYNSPDINKIKKNENHFTFYIFMPHSYLIFVMSQIKKSRLTRCSFFIFLIKRSGYRISRCVPRYISFDFICHLIMIMVFN